MNNFYSPFESVIGVLTPILRQKGGTPLESSLTHPGAKPRGIEPIKSQTIIEA